MQRLLHSFMFPTIDRSILVIVTPLRVALIALNLDASVSSIAGSRCDAGDRLASEYTRCGC